MQVRRLVVVVVSSDIFCLLLQLFHTTRKERAVKWWLGGLGVFESMLY
jgi:hypothetical protein